MPRRHAASGDASPASQSTIHVAIPQQHRPPTRLKLKVRPREPESESEVLLSRPKRKISRPARYSDNVFEPLTKKRRVTRTSNTMYLEKSTSPPPTSELPIGNSSDAISLTSSKSVDKSDCDSNEVQPAGYGADFLNNFIDDTPRSSLSALDSVIGSDRGHKLQSDLLPESDALPDAVSLMYDTFTDLTSEPPTFSVKEVQDPIVLSSSLSSQSDQDSPEICIRKLRNACHALGGLSIPPVPPRNHPVTAPVAKDRDDSVEALLAAAAGHDEVEAEGNDPNKSHDPGEPDEEMMLLINKAIEILNHHIISIRKLETQTAYQKGRYGRGQRYTKGQYRTDTEEFVLSAIEPLLRGGATNIGCIISSERANLLWHLYSQLIHFVTAPHFALPRTFRILQQAANGMSTQQHIMPVSTARQSSKKPSLALPPRKKGKGVKVPVPHQFLSHQKRSS